MIPALVAVLGGVLSALAFPRFGPGLLIVPGVSLFLWSLRMSGSRRHGWLLGFLYGLSFFAGLMWWSIELGWIALIPLVMVLALFPSGFGWWLAGHRESPPGVWFVFVVSLWSVMELIRYHFPFSGIEWGAAGYAISDLAVVRTAAAYIGTSGWTVLLVALAAALVLLATGYRQIWVWAMVALPAVVTVVALGIDWVLPPSSPLPPVRATIVQGSTPCPYEKCPPDERLRTYRLHLELMRTIEPGSTDLIVWAEGSSGSFNADPVQNPDIGEAIGEEAERIGAWALVGTDRPLNDEHWINANVVFDEEGEIVGEYRKQQGVPFGEYIPFRPLFDWIPDLSQVPRDMIPGDGPVVFDADFGRFGSVISFEGSFARYSREHVLAGARLLVIATNEGSYGTTPASDQLIGITRMRAAELGVPVVHAAVTGKSVLIDQTGEFVSEFTGLGTTELVSAAVEPGHLTFYAIVGDWLMYVAAASGLALIWRQRRLLISRE